MVQLVALTDTLPQLDSPDTSATKAFKLSQLANAQQQLVQSQQDDAGARAAFAANPTDPQARLAALASVSPTAYSNEAQRQATLAASDAKTQGAQITNAKNKMALAGQAFGYVMKNPTAQNASDAIDWLQQNGVYSPDEAAAHKATLAQNPGNVQQMATQAFQAAVSAHDQLSKVETKDAGGQLVTQATDPITGQTQTVGTVQKTASPDTLANNRTQLAVQDKITARQDSAGDDDSGLSDATKQRIAQQVVDAGDYSGLRNIGRGKQGAADLRGIQNAITDYASSKGMSPTEISAKLADFEGMKAGIRTSANISARVDNAAAEVDQLMPLALDASQKVSRSGILPFGKLGVMFDTTTNDPDMKRFATANTGLATAYASAMARGNKPTVTDMQHARDLLSTAQDQASYVATVQQMQQEIKAAQAAPQSVRRSLGGEISGKAPVQNPFTPAAASAAPSAAAQSGIPADISGLLNKYGVGND